MLATIRKIVKQQADKEDWEKHILLVVEYSLLLAKKYKVNKQQVELAALLHDIGRLPYSDEKDINHHITGAIKAERILKKFKYSQKRIDEIKQAILCHRGSDAEYKPVSMLDKIIASADAMSHFDATYVFFYWRSDRYSYDEILKWVKDKLKRDWDEKLLLSEAKKIVADKYKAIKLILK